MGVIMFVVGASLSLGLHNAQLRSQAHEAFTLTPPFMVGVQVFLCWMLYLYTALALRENVLKVRLQLFAPIRQLTGPGSPDATQECISVLIAYLSYLASLHSVKNCVYSFTASCKQLLTSRCLCDQTCKIQDCSLRFSSTFLSDLSLPFCICAH